MENPFTLIPYVSEELFCDRDEETSKLISILSGRSNVALISPRRFGKTGLVLRVLAKMKEMGYLTYYVDIFATNSIDDFIKTLSEAILRQIKKDTGISAFLKKLSAVRPQFSYDPLTGAPQLSFVFAQDGDRRQTLSTLFEHLETSGRKVILAFDEFQQIREYEGVRMEALLRTEIQHMRNISFIFCGSKKHIMTDMFSSESGAFYESSRFMFLEEIGSEAYSSFIHRMFDKGGISIDDEAVTFILDWTMRHTFYTQSLCHALFDSGMREIGIDQAKDCAGLLLQENEPRFYEIRGLLTKGQWKYLTAIAKEGTVAQPTAGAFLQKYGIVSASSAFRNLQFLVDKELVLENQTSDGKTYRVYNVFLSRWLERS